MTIKSVKYIDESNIQVTTGRNRKILKANFLKSTITENPGKV